MTNTQIEVAQFKGLKKGEAVQHIMNTRSITTSLLSADIVALGGEVPAKGAKKEEYATVYVNTLFAKKKAKTYTEEEVKALILQATQQTAEAVSEQAVAQVEEKVNVPQQDDRPTVDVGSVYDALTAEAKKLNDQAIVAVKDGNMALYNELTKKHNEVSTKLSNLMMKYKKEIFSVERSKKILDNARQATADALRKTADVTDSYGHKGVDGLLTLASEILNGAVLVTKTGIDVVGKVGHAGVDLTAGTFNMTADLIEKKN